MDNIQKTEEDADCGGEEGFCGSRILVEDEHCNLFIIFIKIMQRCLHTYAHTYTMFYVQAYNVIHICIHTYIGAYIQVRTRVGLHTHTLHLELYRYHFLPIMPILRIADY